MLKFAKRLSIVHLKWDQCLFCVYFTNSALIVLLFAIIQLCSNLFFAHTTMWFLEERDLQARNSGTVKNGDSFDCVNHKRFSVGESLKNWYN